MYTGAHEALHQGRTERPTLAKVLWIIDEASALGADYGQLKPVKLARERAAEAASLLPMLRERMAGADAQMAALTTDFLAGKVDASALADLALSAVTNEQREEARRLIDQAVRGVEANGLAAVLPVTEQQWISPLKPLAAALIEEANEVADAIGITAERIDPVGVRRAGHRWAPLPRDLTKNMGLRHAWERLEEVLGRLDVVHSIADMLRQWGMIPVSQGRTIREDYRWLHLDQLRGDPYLEREFWLQNRSVGGPGVYTSTDLAERGTIRGEARVPTDGHLLNGGVSA